MLQHPPPPQPHTHTPPPPPPGNGPLARPLLGLQERAGVHCTPWAGARLPKAQNTSLDVAAQKTHRNKESWHTWVLFELAFQPLEKCEGICCGACTTRPREAFRCVSQFPPRLQGRVVLPPQLCTLNSPAKPPMACSPIFLVLRTFGFTTVPPCAATCEPHVCHSALSSATKHSPKTARA